MAEAQNGSELQTDGKLSLLVVFNDGGEEHRRIANLHQIINSNIYS